MGLDNAVHPVPDCYALQQYYPNPFNSSKSNRLINEMEATV